MFQFNGRKLLQKIRNTIKKHSVTDIQYINIGTLYLASIALKRGHSVFVKVCCKYDFNKIFMTIKPDILLLTAMDIQAQTALYMASQAKLIKPHTVVIMGGFFPTFRYKEILEKNPDVDFLVIGEGEDTFDELLQFVEGKKKNKHKIKGIAFLNKKKVVFTGKRDLTNIDKFPFPARFLLKRKVNGIMSSRGCNYNCKFCCIKNFYHNIRRQRNVKNFIAELQYLYSQDCSEIKLFDDDFMPTDVWLSKLSYHINKKRLTKLTFSCLMRLDHFIKKGMIKRLDKLNFFTISVGLQNISPEINVYFRTGITKDMIDQFIGILKTRRKIKIRVFYILNSGRAEESKKSICNNLTELLYEITDIKNINVLPFVLTPYSGSDISTNKLFIKKRYSKNQDFFPTNKVTNKELTDLYEWFVSELKKRGQYEEPAQTNIVEKVNDVFFFFTSSLSFQTKIEMLRDAFFWFLYGIVKKQKLNLSIIKERIENKYF